MEKHFIAAGPRLLGESAVLDRRRFLKAATLAGAGCFLPNLVRADEEPPTRAYDGPNVIIVRFGGGVRRTETINAHRTWSPYLRDVLTKRGVLFPKMELGSIEGVETSHGQGTLYILTGKYDRYQDVGQKFLGQRFESKVPTLFEYFRKSFRVPESQAVIINGEDRTDEEFYNFSNHHLFGVNYRSTTLSLYRYKTHVLRRQLAEGRWDGEEKEKKEGELKNLEAIDYRADNNQAGAIEQFWDKWRAYYGETGLVNPRGDRLLTELSFWAMRHLRPKLMMINYNDCDYVHWGNMNHYTRAISIMDHDLQRLELAVQADEAYRDNTIFVVVPDCGRDTNPFSPAPCQHHFGSKSSHEIFALFFGPGIPKGVVYDKPSDQISVAATVGQLMGMKTAFTEGPVLEAALS